jgi:hypothetical protein
MEPMRYKRAAKIILAVLFCAFALRVTWYIARLPESNCSSKPVAESWNEDHAFKVTLIEKNCNAGETLFYSVRVDAHSPPLHGGWFIPGYELEGDDPLPRQIPSLQWVTPRELEIIVNTGTISGTVTNTVHSPYVGPSGSINQDPSDDLLVVRKYVPAHPVLPAASN